jgi:hypothetical protein
MIEGGVEATSASGNPASKGAKPGWRDFLSVHEEEWAALAWAGYSRSGSGAVAVFLNEARANNNWSAPIAYLPEVLLADRSDRDEWQGGRALGAALLLLDKYDPCAEFVAIIFGNAGEPGYSPVRVTWVRNTPVRPPEAYSRILTHGADFVGPLRRLGIE